MRFLLALVVLLPRWASAECAIRQWVGTADGTKIPVSGQLYVHDEGLRYGDASVPGFEASWLGQRGDVQIQVLEGSVAIVHYVGFAGSTLVLKSRYGEQWKYPLIADWAEPVQP